MHRNHAHPNERSAFTLLELLVVIAIIGVLAALAVPAMSKAYGVAAETRCISNLRSLAQATAAYTVDHKQRFPGSGGPDIWYSNAAGAKGSSGSARNLEPGDRVLNAYMNDAHEAAVCPLDRGSTSYNNAPTVAAQWGSSYVLMDSASGNLSRRRVRNGIWSLEGFGLLDVSSPATKMAMADFIVLRNLASGEQHAWHGEKDGHLRSGMSFVDGHATSLRLKVEPATVSQGTQTLSYNEIRALATSDAYY